MTKSSTGTNDAAERLRNFFRDEGFPEGSWTFENLDEALAAEWKKGFGIGETVGRRAAVDRIRAMTRPFVNEEDPLSWTTTALNQLDALLDRVAAE